MIPDPTTVIHPRKSPSLLTKENRLKPALKKKRTLGCWITIVLLKLLSSRAKYMLTYVSTMKKMESYFLPKKASLCL